MQENEQARTETLERETIVKEDGRKLYSYRFAPTGAPEKEQTP